MARSDRPFLHIWEDKFGKLETDRINRARRTGKDRGLHKCCGRLIRTLADRERHQELFHKGEANKYDDFK